MDNTYKAAFEINDYVHFVRVQTETALRKLAGIYPTDNFEDHDAEITLRGGSMEVNDELEKEIVEGAVSMEQMALDQALRKAGRWKST